MFWDSVHHLFWALEYFNFGTVFRSCALKYINISVLGQNINLWISTLQLPSGWTCIFRSGHNRLHIWNNWRCLLMIQWQWRLRISFRCLNEHIFKHIFSDLLILRRGVILILRSKREDLLRSKWYLRIVSSTHIGRLWNSPCWIFLVFVVHEGARHGVGDFTLSLRVLGNLRFGVVWLVGFYYGLDLFLHSFPIGIKFEKFSVSVLSALA